MHRTSGKSRRRRANRLSNPSRLLPNNFANALGCLLHCPKCSAALSSNTMRESAKNRCTDTPGRTPWHVPKQQRIRHTISLQGVMPRRITSTAVACLLDTPQPTKIPHLQEVGNFHHVWPQVLVLAPLVMPGRATASSQAGPPQWVHLPSGHSRSWTKGKVHRVGPMRTHRRCAHRSSVGGSRRPSPTPTIGKGVGNKCRGRFRIRCHWLDNYGRGGVADQSLAARDE